MAGGRRRRGRAGGGGSLCGVVAGGRFVARGCASAGFLKVGGVSC